MKVYWGWVVCICFLLLFTLAIGVIFSFSEVLIPLNKEVHESLTLLGCIGSVQMSLPMLAAPFGNYLNFKFGTRRTVMVGVMVASMAMAVTALVSHVALLMVVYGFIGGMDMMLIMNPPFFLLDEYFPYYHPRHVLATSIIACGFPLATLIFNPLAFVLLDSVGWRRLYSIYAVALMVVGLGAGFTFRPKYNEEQDESQVETDSRRRRREYEEILETTVPVCRRTRLVLGGIWLMASTLKGIGYYTPFITLVKQMDVLGIPQYKSSQAMAVVGACEFVSRLVTSYVGDYFKGKIMYVYVVCTLALCVQNMLGSLAYTFTHLLIYAAAMGILGGPIIAAIYSSCSEVMQCQNVPALFSVFRVGLGIGMLIGPISAGCIGSVQMSLPMLAAPFGNYLNFKFGTRRTVMVGVMVASMAMAVTALVSHVALLMVVYGFIGGMDMMLIMNPPFFLLDEYFPYYHPRHVLATSIIACGFPLATLIFNPLAFVLLDSVGWRRLYSIYAVALMVVGLGAGFTFRPKYNEEQDESQVETDSRRRRREYEEILETTVPVCRRTRLVLGGIWLMASTLKGIGYYTPFITLVKQMDVLGIPQYKSSQAMAVVGACEFVSRLVTSYVGDYFKGKIMYVYVVCTLALCVQNMLGSLAYTFTHLLIYAAAMGILGGPIIAAIYSSCSEVMQCQNVPALFSVFRVGLGIGMLIGPISAGAIFDTTSSFYLVFYLNGSTYFLTSILYALIIFLNKKRPKWCFPDTGEEIPLTSNAADGTLTEVNGVASMNMKGQDIDSDSFGHSAGFICSDDNSHESDRRKEDL